MEAKFCGKDSQPGSPDIPRYKVVQISFQEHFLKETAKYFIDKNCQPSDVEMAGKMADK